MLPVVWVRLVPTGNVLLTSDWSKYGEFLLASIPEKGGGARDKERGEGNMEKVGWRGKLHGNCNH